MFHDNHFVGVISDGGVLGCFEMPADGRHACFGQDVLVDPAMEIGGLGSFDDPR